MTNHRASAAVQDVLDAAAMLGLAFSNVKPGTRLAALRDSLSGLQQKLSRVEAILAMDEDIRLTFDEGTEFTSDELRELSELEKAVAFSLPDKLPGQIDARVLDGRVIAGQLQQALDGRRIDIVWDSTARVGHVNIGPLLADLVEQIDPHGEDVPGFWADDEEDEA